MNSYGQVLQTFQKYLRAANENEGATAAKFFSAHSTMEIFYREAGSYKLSDQVMGQELVDYVVRHLLPFRSDEGVRRLCTDHIVDIQNSAASLTANFLVIARSNADPRENCGPTTASNINIVRSGIIRAALELEDHDWKIVTLSVFDDGLPPESKLLSR